MPFLRVSNRPESCSDPRPSRSRLPIQVDAPLSLHDLGARGTPTAAPCGRENALTRRGIRRLYLRQRAGRMSSLSSPVPTVKPNDIHLAGCPVSRLHDCVHVRVRDPKGLPT